MKWIAAPIVGLVILSLLVRVFAMLGILPKPKPILDADRAILFHQADASQGNIEAKVLLIGDSSCLMDVDAAYLETLLDKKTLNLGTLSYLNLESFGTLLRNYKASNRYPPEHVVLLVHPEFLRRAAPSKVHVAALQHYLSGDDYSYSAASPFSPSRLFGFHIAQGRLQSRIPVPLAGDFARFYGFTSDLMRFMTQHQGSAVDPGELSKDDLSGSDQYRIAQRHRDGAATFLEAVPPESRLLVGLTPIPDGFATADYGERFDKLLAEWHSTLGSEGTLLELPATLPNDRFSSKTHLNQESAIAYTEELALLFETLPSTEVR